MSRQLALGGQPVLVADAAEAQHLLNEQRSLNRLLLVDARVDDAWLVPLVRTATELGCRLVVCLGGGAEQVHRAVEAACEAEAAGHLVATSWHDWDADAEAAVDAFALFTTWVGGPPGSSLLVTEDAGLDTILDAARTLSQRRGQHRSQ